MRKVLMFVAVLVVVIGASGCGGCGCHSGCDKGCGAVKTTVTTDHA